MEYKRLTKIGVQRTIGNQAVQRLIKSGTLQAKLKIGQPGDKYEQKADRVADAVMRMPEPGVQRQVEPEEEEEETLQAKPLAEEITPLVQRQVEPEEELQTKATSGHLSEVTANLESNILSLKGSGQPLPESDRAHFEPRFGRDFSHVRVHMDEQAADSAEAMHARAYTTGNHIVFGAGQFVPKSTEGRLLLAHELTHVVQQQERGDHSETMIQRWMGGDHAKLTEEETEKLLIHFPDFKMDAVALNSLGKYSADMDNKIEELWFNVGSVGRKQTISEYYKRHHNNARNHGEGGCYDKELGSSESVAAKKNILQQQMYEDQARSAFLKIPSKFSSITASMTIKPRMRQTVLSILGDALHVAQDRGAHREGAHGMGHDNPLINPDNPSENPKGYTKARRNTEIVLLKASDILYRLLHEDFVAKHTAVFPAEVRIIQRTQDNRYVQRVVSGIQAKLVVGQPGDVYEQEADRVADEVMRMPEPEVRRQVDEEQEEEILQIKPLVDQITPVVQRQVEEEEEEEETLQAKSTKDATSEVTNDLESQINAIQGGGRPLGESERAYFEPRFGVDFSRVRVHTDTQADESARAYTVGQDVVFGAGQYAPGTSEGRRLMAHELTHVVQQSGKK